MNTYEVVYKYSDGTYARASLRTYARSYNYIAVSIAMPYARVWSIVLLAST